MLTWYYLGHSRRIGITSSSAFHSEYWKTNGRTEIHHGCNCFHPRQTRSPNRQTHYYCPTCASESAWEAKAIRWLNSSWRYSKMHTTVNKYLIGKTWKSYKAHGELSAQNQKLEWADSVGRICFLFTIGMHFCVKFDPRSQLLTSDRPFFQTTSSRIGRHRVSDLLAPTCVVSTRWLRKKGLASKAPRDL